MHRVLICDDDSIFQINTRRALQGSFEIYSAYNGDEALTFLKKQSIDILLLDLIMRSPDEGFRFIPKLLEIDPDLAIVIVSATRDFNSVREAMRLGAADYIVKDIDTDSLMHTLHQVLLRRSLLQRQHQQDFETLSAHRQNTLVGTSDPILQLRKVLNKLKNCQENILILGETGTGKELVARQLRRKTPNGSLVPFVAIDSATIQSSMAESLLFGHEKGAFTGADKTTKGIFEEANHGIVYFDEIANMPIEIQTKLLRVLQEKEISRLGSSKTIPLDFQIICATNRNLDLMVKQGEFKNDLLQRINVIPIRIPPLRERQTDIPALVEYFCHHCRDGSSLKFSSSSMHALSKYSWPGNVRELRNVITYLATLADDHSIDFEDLPEKIKSETTLTSAQPESAKTFYARIALFEEKLLRQAYTEHPGSIKSLAFSLKMDRSHLYTKLKSYGIYAPGEKCDRKSRKSV